MTLPMILMGSAAVIAGVGGLMLRAGRRPPPPPPLRTGTLHVIPPEERETLAGFTKVGPPIRCLPPGGRSTGVYLVGPYRGAKALWELYSGNRRINTYTRKFTALKGARRLLKRVDW